jgi:hypothetical protein
MTTRVVLNARRRRIMTVAMAGFGAGFVGVILAEQGILDFAPYHAGLPGALVFCFALGYAQVLAFRCPRCAGQWGPLVISLGYSLFRMDDRIRFCPF